MKFLSQLIGSSAHVGIDDATWTSTLERHSFLQRLTKSEQARLRTHAAQLISKKSFTGVADFVLTDEIVVAIAAQACLPVLNLGIDAFDHFQEIVVYPGEFLVRREVTDDDGVVHDESGPLSGEAMPGGPVVLSWNDVAEANHSRDGCNVVVHEFAHKLDMADGMEADGVPPLHPRLHTGLSRQIWIETLDAAYEDYCEMLDNLESSIPAEVDPESEEGRRLYAALPLDPYAATHPAEFFAVASEAYFVSPARLHQSLPALFDLLDRYYRPTLARLIARR
ncbi:MAG TPA: M90 family metallopeptidase [Burkholderiaceae bacterium]|nr:M90 family metallopeptidase [Burkholderiaceae bacterium]